MNENNTKNTTWKSRGIRTLLATLGTVVIGTTVISCSSEDSEHDSLPSTSATHSAQKSNSQDNTGNSGEKKKLKVATYNASLNRSKEGELIEDLSTPHDPQAQAVASIIRSQNPDVIVLNEFDYDEEGKALALFQENYLEKYPYSFSTEVNTGVDSGLDLNNNGTLHEPDDAWGYGAFPGQYGMAVLSRYPLDTESLRSFRTLLWKDMPDSLIPTEFYGQVADKVRLSSKSHWDLPLIVDDRRIHLLISHPTPPSFDGPEKRNGRRNSDEIRLTADYIAGGQEAEWIVDDAGQRGGLDPEAEFIVFGDQNSDPKDGGAGFPGIKQLLSNPRVQDPKPTSRGSVEAASSQEGNENHSTPAEQDTADFSDPTPGNLRVDYVLPSTGLTVVDSQVIWPTEEEPMGELMDPKKSSDHRMVVLTIEV